MWGMKFGPDNVVESAVGLQVVDLRHVRQEVRTGKFLVRCLTECLGLWQPRVT